MKHVIQQLEVEIKGLDNLIKHVGEKQKVAARRAIELAAEAAEHDSTLTGIAAQRDKLRNAIEAMKSL